VAGSVFCTVYLEYINIRGFKHALRLIRGDFSDGKGKGEISHFNALCTAVSGTVGIGNIAGIPIAIAVGGPGDVFWMLVAGFLGMSTKFVECTLAVMFCKENADGTVSGGPMYYLTQGLAKIGRPWAVSMPLVSCSAAWALATCSNQTRHTVSFLWSSGGSKVLPGWHQSLCPSWPYCIF